MSNLTVHRVEVRPTPEAGDPHGASVCATAQAAGLDAQPARVDTSNIYLLEGNLSADDVQQLAADLLPIQWPKWSRSAPPPPPPAS